MAFKTKSLSDLVRVCENELSVQFYGESSVLRKSVLKVLAAVLGGALYMMSLLAVRIWRDRFVSTCGDDALDGFGTEYGIPHKAPLYARVFSVSSVPVEVVAAVSPFTESVKGSVKTALERALRKCEPGKSVSKADLELAVLSGSTAESFVVSDLKKNGTPVSKLSLGLYEDAENGIVAEAAELDLTLRNGEG